MPVRGAPYDRVASCHGDRAGGPAAERRCGMALGDPDAVLGRTTSTCRTRSRGSWPGEPRATDERMLDLLEPYRGQRARAMRLITYSGRHAPKFGLWHRLRDIAAI